MLPFLSKYPRQSPPPLSLSIATNHYQEKNNGCFHKQITLLSLLLLSTTLAHICSNFHNLQGLVNKESNPYTFNQENCEEVITAQEGNVKLLQRFSGPLPWIEDHRISIFEANPSTFSMPVHFDAEAVFFVVRGRGIINLIQEEKRKSYQLEHGDVIRIPAGTMVYLINMDNKEKLNVAQLFQPIAVPSQFRPYNGVGGEDPESYYEVLSDDILQVAFNTPKEKLQKLFGQQKGVMIRASQQQIRALSKHVTEGSPSEILGGPHKLLRRPTYHLLRLIAEAGRHQQLHTSTTKIQSIK